MKQASRIFVSAPISDSARYIEKRRSRLVDRPKSASIGSMATPLKKSTDFTARIGEITMPVGEWAYLQSAIIYTSETCPTVRVGHGDDDADKIDF